MTRACPITASPEMVASRDRTAGTAANRAGAVPRVASASLLRQPGAEKGKRHGQGPRLPPGSSYT